MLVKTISPLMQQLERELTAKTMPTREVYGVMQNVMMQQRHRFAMMPVINTDMIPSHYLDNNAMAQAFEDLTPTVDVEVGTEGETVVGTSLPEIETSLRAKGVTKVRWVDLQGMPSMMNDYVRALGNAIFGQFGIKEKAKVLVIASFDDAQLTHHPSDLNAVVNFLHGTLPSLSADNMIMDFSPAIEGYKPELRLYYSPTHAYMVINEPKGQGASARYVYAFERHGQTTQKD